MKSKLFLLCVLVGVLSAGSAFAGISDTEQEKIAYLKAELLASGCEYERNGKRYDAEQAVSHINRKHDYFMDEIDSVEKFIELTATKSTMSGRPYYIHCPGTEKTESSVWLHDRLDEFAGSDQ